MNVNDLTLFVRIADSGNITRAAQQLDISAAAASAAIKRLEKQLGVALFIRSTRQLRITGEGERFLVYCREALASLNAGQASIHSLKGKVAGELRISAPSDLGRNMLLDWVDEIMLAHPDLSIHLFLGDSLSDFYLDRVDLAIRYGNQEDSSMVAFELATINRILCASPTYLAKHGLPTKPSDLSKHNCLLLQLNSRPNRIWELVSNHQDDTGALKIQVRSDRCANDGDVVRRWAVAGRGIAFKSRLDVSEDLKSGRLVRVLPDHQSRRISLNLLSPTRRQITPAVLLLRDMLRAKFAQRLAI
ncbi:LysR family transcriptional regulator [Arenicella xantha]|uniref:LysR family transcriptional regulator n=1 Tax=Arenicella xantha TaxID=644221 RepID=A0A395JG32_9GAMM|nr:LysR family transcriptional regulator [Arenicella xantha]RBP48763.1 LysR family transcriptional regulator [Arenicella xantha]